MLAQGAVERRDLVADSSEVPGDLFGQGEDLGEALGGLRPVERLTCVEMVSRRDCVATGRGRPLRTRKRMAASAGADSS